ncbi:inositol -trisphosphate receptor-interacting 1 [Limosa lapponica baueri]|uniref:Inositol-trisphosphate receptor-interacting 1 n=1 Tax=Limosa lapponica baueri TaxID=1758121 RepID=A0A2I0T1I4_LIMLA|nr:inositol -trisphosphate receptor-interacting 1 [Limosa lapponica baueri]
MAAASVLALIALLLVQLPPMVGEELDEATVERMQWHAEFLNGKMTRLQHGLGQRNAEQSDFAWGALLSAAFKLMQFLTVAGYLVLLFRCCLWLRKRIRQRYSSDGQKSSSSSSSRKKEESSRSSMEEVEEEEEWKEEDSNDKEHLFREHIRCSARSTAQRSQEVETLVGNLLGVFQERLSKSFFVVPQAAIGVGSAFEGWSPRVHDALYCLLVPLKPSRGHSFHLEVGTAQEVPAKHRVRVELECTCRRDARGEDMLCFVHQPYEALARDQDSSLLSNLCTGRYLDAQKTARWFQSLVSSAWGEMPHSPHYAMRVLPSRRSCKLELTHASGRSLFVELLFGVQQGDSDIFLSSQAPEAIFTPGTMWAESSAVAEAKFFSHVARQAPRNTVHLTCLQLCARTLVGTGLCPYTLKTVVMHLLNTIPASDWTRASFLMRLQDVMLYLRSCLEEKHLNHFFFGNDHLPEDITLPPAFQEAEPINLFQCLVQDAEAYNKALRELEELEGRLTGLLLYGV